MRVTRELYEVDGWGVGEVVHAGGILLAHELPGPGGGPGGVADEPADGVAAVVAERVRAHLDGTPTSYADLELDLSWCTPLQARLADALREVQWGEVVTYGELAALAGRPGAARAAGSFCAGNRFALVFPCHRVVAANGIGGYGASGVELKRRLLALEGVHL